MGAAAAGLLILLSIVAAEPQWFYAGACLDTYPRAMAIPGRTYYSYDGATAIDPLDLMAEAGFNAFRVETSQGQCVAPTKWDDTNVLNRERNFLADTGQCMDTEVKLAQRAIGKGMKMVWTQNFDELIPDAWVNHTYVQMLGEIDTEVRRQMQPFMDANIQPDIILLQNEGTSGILFRVNNSGTTRIRGLPSAGIPQSQIDEEVCGLSPTGFQNFWPQLGGYYKQWILTARSVLSANGMDDSRTRFGLHSHGQYFDWWNSVIYQTNVSDTTQGTCNFTNVIPANILNLKAREMMDIMGLSAYPDPMTPVNYTASGLAAMNNRMTGILKHLDQYQSNYGRYTSGPFAGQWKKQLLGVEYATAFDYPTQKQALVNATQSSFNLLKSRDYVLGVLWWEPTYGLNNWNADTAGLYHGNYTGPYHNITPMTAKTALATWGANAISYPISHNLSVDTKSSNQLSPQSGTATCVVIGVWMFVVSFILCAM